MDIKDTPEFELLRSIKFKKASLNDPGVAESIHQALQRGALTKGLVHAALLGQDYWETINAALRIVSRPNPDREKAGKAEAAIALGNWPLIDQALSDVCSVGGWQEKVGSILEAVGNGEIDPEHPIIMKALNDANQAGFIGRDRIMDATYRHYRQDRIVRGILDRVRGGECPYTSWIEEALKTGVEKGFFTENDVYAAKREYHLAEIRRTTGGQVETVMSEGALHYLLQDLMKDPWGWSNNEKIRNAERRYQRIKARAERFLRKISEGLVDPEIPEVKARVSRAVRDKLVSEEDVQAAIDAHHRASVGDKIKDIRERENRVREERRRKKLRR